MTRPHSIGLTIGLLVGLWISHVMPTPAAWADTHDSKLAPSKKLERLFEQLGNLHFGLGATGIIQGTLNNDDNNPDAGDVTDATWSLDFEIGAPIGQNGQVFVLIEAGQGDGLTDEAGVGDSFFGVNDDAGDSEAHLDVTELWYEHRFWGDRIFFTAGKVDLTNYFDTNAVANDETTQFLSTGLVNSVAVEFPEDNGVGVRLTVSPVSWLDLSAAWGEADADFEDLFANSFVIFEVAVKPNLANRAGTYRFYVWGNWTDHLNFNTFFDTDDPNWGLGVSMDQVIVDPVTLFFRWAMQDDDVSVLVAAWSVGLETRGVWWKRQNDVIAIAVGQAQLSSPFKRSILSPLHPDDESFIEAYYRFVFNDHLELSLHLQVIDNAGGNASQDTVTVVGGRVQINL